MKKKKSKMEERLTVRLPESQHQTLLRTAAASDRSVGYLVRTALARTYGDPAETQPQN